MVNVLVKSAPESFFHFMHHYLILVNNNIANRGKAKAEKI